MVNKKSMLFDFEFFKDKTVLVTGHTGFKGVWLCKILKYLGANIIGYALIPTIEPNLFNLTEISNQIISIFGDIRDLDHLENTFIKYKPEIVIHLAAQPLVRESYLNPVYTFDANIMGTVNILECVRKFNTVKSFLNVTTDKVYQNNEWIWGYRENDILNGMDPYSNSKSCSELVTFSYKNSFFLDTNTSISTARAGNVIGGGDFSKDRIIPDCVKSAINKETINVRNPHSIRPYQHVLEPLFAYLLIVQKQYLNKELEGNYNVGPSNDDCITTRELVEMFCNKWGNNLDWKEYDQKGPKESSFLKLDCTKINSLLNWYPILNIEQAIEKTIDWTKVYLSNENINLEIDKEIQFYINEMISKQF